MDGTTAPRSATTSCETCGVVAMLGFGFREMALNRVEADVTVGNEASVRVLSASTRRDCRDSADSGRAVTTTYCCSVCFAASGAGRGTIEDRPSGRGDAVADNVAEVGVDP